MFLTRHIYETRLEEFKRAITIAPARIAKVIEQAKLTDWLIDVGLGCVLRRKLLLNY